MGYSKNYIIYWGVTSIIIRITPSFVHTDILQILQFVICFLFTFTKPIGNRHFSIHYERSSIPVIMLPQESDSVYQIKLQIPVC